MRLCGDCGLLDGTIQEQNHVLLVEIVPIHLERPLFDAVSFKAQRAI